MAVSIDAKEIINEVFVKKRITVDAMRERMRLKVATAVRYGKPLHIRMANTAMDWAPFCGDFDGALPKALFHAAMWKDFATWSKVLKPEELEDSCISMEAHFVFITSDFDLNGVKEHLENKLPLFESLAIIDIDAESI